MQQAVIQGNDETFDLTATFPIGLVDGEHRIHTTPDGLHLIATVEGSKIILWRVTDDQGHEYRVSLKSLANPPDTCEICVPNPAARCVRRGPYGPCGGAEGWGWSKPPNMCWKVPMGCYLVRN